MRSKQREHCQGSLDKLLGALKTADDSPNDEALNNVRLCMDSLAMDYYSITLLDEAIDPALRAIALAAADRALAITIADPPLHAHVRRQRDCIVKQPSEILDLQREVEEYDEGLDFDE